MAFPSGRQSATTVVRLEALADELVNDDRLTLDLGEAAYGAGTVDGSFAIKVRDTTVKQIAPKPDVAVTEAFGDAGRGGGRGWNTGDRGEASFPGSVSPVPSAVRPAVAAYAGE